MHQRTEANTELGRESDLSPRQTVLHLGKQHVKRQRTWPGEQALEQAGPCAAHQATGPLPSNATEDKGVTGLAFVLLGKSSEHEVP